MSTLQIRRLGYALGAEISGVDLTQPYGDDLIADIRQAILDSIMVCLRGQDLTPAGLAAFCAKLGPIDERLPVLPVPDPACPGVQEFANKPILVNGKVGTYAIADMWHTDRDFTDSPTTLKFLLAKDLPDMGGDTMFANTYLAHETLSPTMQKLLAPLEAVHASTSDSALGGVTSRELQEQVRKQNPRAAHALVRVHPETRRKALYVGSRLQSIVGMTAEESKPLIDELNQHAVRYEFIYRHRWALGDLVIWDNRCSLHYAVPDYDRTHLRRMLRCSLLGPKTGYAYPREESLAFT